MKILQNVFSHYFPCRKFTQTLLPFFSTQSWRPSQIEQDVVKWTLTRHLEILHSKENEASEIAH